MCGGFTCTKNSLIALNVLYVMIGFLLIGVAVYARAASIVINLPTVGGILACGVILILISILGLAGAIRHHQVILFFYMIILFILFVIQFSVASSCLSQNKLERLSYAEEGWSRVSDAVHKQVQDSFYCCGFNTTSQATAEPSCEMINKQCCLNTNDPDCSCPPCLEVLEDKIHYAFKLCGGLAMFFSFTEVFAVFLTYIYRNQQDPFYLPPRAVLPENYIF